MPGQNGATGAPGARGPQGIPGEAGLPGESGEWWAAPGPHAVLDPLTPPNRSTTPLNVFW